MPRSPRIIRLQVIALLLLIGACDFDVINTDPNNPTDVPVSSLLPNAQMALVFSELGTDPQWFTSVLVQHTTGVHAQLNTMDQLAGITPSILDNNFTSIFVGVLPDLEVIISKGTADESWNYVGIARTLKAFTFQHATDLFGRLPYRQATAGSSFLQPEYDSQQFIYDELQTLLDEAIADLQRPTPTNAGMFDLLYQGDSASWIRAAYSLKARLYNRLSKRDGEASAMAALASAQNAFQTPDQDMIFEGYGAGATEQHPWFQERNERAHHAWSARLHALLAENEDPRLDRWAQPMPDGEIVPAPNGIAELDQAGNLYSKLSGGLIHAEQIQPIITYAEVQFIKAEALLRLGQAANALEEYRLALIAALEYAGVPQPEIEALLARPAVLPEDPGELTTELIIEQKYLFFFPFQPAEAYSDWRRTGYPELINPRGSIPRRFPVGQAELDANPHAQNVPISDGVWWDDGTE